MTFLVVWPLTQLIVLVLFGLAIATFGVGVAEGVGEVTTASCVNLIRIVGAEKPNPFILK